MPAREQKTAVGTSGGYDQSLIAKAPEITKLDRQVRVWGRWGLLKCLLAHGCHGISLSVAYLWLSCNY